ncbi:MAG: hypothetical protein SCH71_14885 [Desulfobulbaceae bacterium]|nr:hypothetical protein [Desulfobulbaceae bacterium]
MRCPKCSYISFDLVESCPKCGKNVSNTAEDLRGTVADVELPSFLKFNIDSYGTEAVEEAEDAFEDGMVMELDVEEGEELTDFAFDHDRPAAAEEADFSLEEEAADKSEPAQEILAEEKEDEQSAEAVLDISDLAPDDEPVGEPVEEDFAFDSEPAGEHTAGELEDLVVEGIDLEISSIPNSGKVMPAVKTGTALDNFDIDLGDLFTAGKKEKVE